MPPWQDMERGGGGRGRKQGGEHLYRSTLTIDNACNFARRYFNLVQSACLPAAFSDAAPNLVLSAPTGSGKTVVFELALVALLRGGCAAGSAVYTPRPGRLKMIYLAPLKALVAEKFRDWSARFGPVGLTFRELTGL